MPLKSYFLFFAVLFTACVSQADTEKCDSLLQIARSEGLHYVKNFKPGISRRILANGEVRHYQPNGRRIKSKVVEQRINDLSVPASYADVWISTDPRAHIQGIATDSNGKRQYFYHPRWVDGAADAKFLRLKKFGATLPFLRQMNHLFLRQDGFPKEKILALITELLQSTLIRVGNEEAVEDNESFGLTTLRKEHVVHRNPVILYFKGKSHKWHKKIVANAGHIQLIRQLMKLPGENLFQYVDQDGNTRQIDANDVNEHLKEIAGPDFSAKDFRTWMATFYATKFLLEAKRPNKSDYEKLFDQAAAYAAEFLGNTAEVCRQSYIHPEIFNAYNDKRRFERAFRIASKSNRKRADIVETAILRLLP